MKMQKNSNTKMKGLDNNGMPPCKSVNKLQKLDEITPLKFDRLLENFNMEVR